jgi:RHS repeat-associated protein
VNPNQPIDVYATGSAAAGTTVTAPSVTTTHANDQLLVFQGAFGTFSGKTWTAPTGTAEAAQVNSTANDSTGLAAATLGASGPTGTETSTFGASANLTTVSVALSQAPPQASGITLVGTPATSSGKQTSVTITLPSGTVAGDEVVLGSTQRSTTTVTAPSTYTQVATVTSAESSPLATTTVFRHTVVTGDTSVTMTYSTNTSAYAVVVAVYSGVNPNQPIDVYATGSAAAGTTVTAPSVTTTHANDQLLVFQGAFGTFSGYTWTAPSGTTEVAQVNSTANDSTGLATEALGASGATGTEKSTFGATANLTTVSVALSPAPNVLYFHQDQLGSTRMLTNSAGAAEATFTYDPYGNLPASTGTAATPFLFAGQYRDAETGFYYLRARYYDPSTAQFLTVDADVATTLSPYGYVQENPLNRSDPGGLMNDASSGSGGYYTSGPEKGCEINLSGGPALCPIGGGQVAPMGSAPAGGASLVPNYVSTCLSFVIGELCLTRTDGGHTYVSIGPGLGTPGVSDSSGYVRGGSADQMISGWSVHVGGGTFVGGGYASGGACPLGSGPQGPYGSVETPGSAGIFWTYGFGI